MNTPPSFELAGTALLPGVTLIEASAGTGKTFTIAGLFLRLLIEQKLSVSEILVVTYTEAATEELRGRIRQTLADAVAAFTAGASERALLQSLVEQRRAESADVLARLEQALSNFDEAPIFTIHGFCQRQLRDRAFESGALFDTELLTDPSALLQEVADDYWRRNFYEAQPLPVLFALKNRLGPDRLLPELELHSRHPELRLDSPVAGRTLTELSAELCEAFAEAKASWQAHGPELRDLFARVTDWAIGDHARPEVVADKLADLERCFSEAATPESFECLEFFTSSAIQRETSKSKTSPRHAFFDLCEKLLRRERGFVIGVRLDFPAYARKELPRRKQRLKVQTFDDLLTRLHAALIAPGGERLAAAVRARYKAALIDEFQDTDPVQYQIFRRLFAPGVRPCPGAETRERQAAADKFEAHRAGHVPAPGDGHTPPEPLLFLIGDPKQAIYGFRGADFFTYLDAARRADRHFTLEANWRAESGLVRAVNTLFQRATAPFVFDEIPFHPVVARGEADSQPLLENGERPPPLRVWFHPRGGDGKTIAGEQAEEVVPRVVASEITRLLNGGARLGNRPLGPQDIAVLVLKHRQAALLQEALRALNIPSVLHTEASLFASPEARELHRVLAAIAEPGNERLLRAALATSLLGVDGAELDALARDEARWQDRLERFHRYADWWTDRGFTPMMRAWLHEEQLRQRLLAFPDGERRLTNVLHLAEALHQAALERRLGPAGLQQWLADHIASEDKAAEEHQLRLERDDFAVRLVTIHKSKGLEYPVVFCPFAWKSSDLKWRGEDQVFCHERPDGGDSLFIRDLGSEQYDRRRELAFREKLAENVRLLYVALTRARNRCYVVWGNFRNAGTSALARLLHPSPAMAGGLLEQMEAHFKLLDDAAMRRDLQELASASATDGASPAILVQDLPTATDQPYRPPVEATPAPQARVFTGAIERDWGVTSFSALAAHRREEQPDYDGFEVPAPPAAAPGEGIFAFPRGTKAGTCLHKIFETLDFTTADGPALDRVVREQLQAHGFDGDQFAPALGECVRRTLRVPLDPARPQFTLSSIPPDVRLHELEFNVPLKRTTPATLRSLLGPAAKESGAAFDRLTFDPVSGYLQGFIDLAFQFEGKFHLVDWKSNWLGNQVEDYHGDALRREMNERLYPLQYLLYTLALHQYLALRLPGYKYDRHFGGVFYLFVRGLDPARPEFGVFRDRPPAGLIERLNEGLIAGREAAGG
jgi:exodeoxyribonuclease V beta subunit